MRPAIVSMPDVGEVQKVSKIHKAALLYIFLSSLRGYGSSILL